MAKLRGGRNGKDGAQDPIVENVIERIRAARNFDFRNYKRAALQRRLERRMAACHCASLPDYVALLEREPAEFDALIASILIKVTGFFRDPEMWDVLSRKVIPRLLAEKPAGEEIRVWCAGCATGEEAFSLAILLADALGPALQNQDVKIFGTDVDEQAIAFARRGVYSRAQLEGVSPATVKKWFVDEGGGVALRKEIRRAVVFGINNLVADAPISRLDLLLCRNVFIYMDGELQNRVLTHFHYALRRNGVLVLGKSELIPFAAKLFEPLDLQRRIYRKDRGREAALAREHLVSLLGQDRGGKQGARDLEGVDQFHRDVVRSLQTPVIATSADGTILLWNPAAAALWRKDESEVAGKKLASLGLPGLSGDVLIEKTRAIREGRAAVEHGVGVLNRRQGEPLQLEVEITPMREAARGVSGLLYLIRDVTAMASLEAELRRSTVERESTLQELQTINQELQSANEELETTNEELQSTNEELETTNEELQSTNAELDATNRELAHRTEEMNALTFVQRITIRTLNVAVVVLDRAGKVELWNLAAERLLGIPEHEAVGQNFWTLNIPALGRGTLQKMRKAMAENTPLRAEQVPYELPNGAQGKASVAAVPIVDEGSVLGSVISFEDATRVATLSAELATLKADGVTTNGKRNRR
jgi:two-component system, chemotaxis family, CheB/CheR fusion protein